VITFSIWMIWHMWNYARFKDKIDVSRAISVIKDLTCLVGKDFWPWWGYFFGFYYNGVRLKKITNLGKLCQFGTTSYAQIVPIWHDSAMSYWSCVNLARLLPCHTEVVPTWHDFCHVIILFFLNFIVYILGSKLCNVKN